MALFGRQAQQRAGGSRYLLEFKAGKMTMDGNMVKPDPRKGTIYLDKTEEGMQQLCWKERGGQNAEDTVIIFPDEVEFKRVPQCTTGRVFLLKFKGSSRRCFYWMQEPDAAKDEEIFQKITDFLAGNLTSMMPLALPFSGGSAPLNLQAMLNDGNIQEMLSSVGGLDRDQLMSMLMDPSAAPGAQAQATPQRQQGASATAQATPTAATGLAPIVPGAPSKVPKGAAGKSGKIGLEQLQGILGNLPAGQSRPGEAAGGQEPSATPDWTPALSQRVLLPILSNPEFVQRLVPHLPQDPNIPHTAQEVMSTIQSPQFQQAIQAFTSAFESRQLGPLIQEFNLGADAVQAANNGDFAAFVRALEKANNQGAAAKPADKNMDDEMNVD